MTVLRAIFIVLLVCLALDRPYSPTQLAVAKEDVGPTSLFMMEPEYGRTLLPLNGLNLTDTVESNPITLGGLSTGTSAWLLPQTLLSQSGTALATITNRCPGCQAYHAKYVTVRIYRLDTGLLVAKFHPHASIDFRYLADDGSRMAGFHYAQGQTDTSARWFTLDVHTGRAIKGLSIPNVCCGESVYDPHTDRLYITSTSVEHHLMLSSYNASSGELKDHLIFAGIASGNQYEGNDANGAPMKIHLRSPGIALAPDGRQLAILDQNTHLTTVDPLSMRVLDSRELTRPQSTIDRVVSMLGLAPRVAEAKEIADGALVHMQYARDGRSLLVTGTRYSLDANGAQVVDGLGVERIDVATGTLVGQALGGHGVNWVGEAADGSAVYALTPVNTMDSSCPCTLSRLQSTNLDITAQRSFRSGSAPPRLFIVGN